MTHAIKWQGCDYQPRGSVDAQLEGWVVRCECGEEFQHCAPDGARDAHRLHAEEASE